MKNNLHPGFGAGRTFMERLRPPPQAADEGGDDEEEEAICCGSPPRSGPAAAVWLTLTSEPSCPSALLINATLTLSSPKTIFEGTILKITKLSKATLERCSCVLHCLSHLFTSDSASPLGSTPM